MNKLDRVLEIFKEMTQIPHCSGDTEELKHYIMEFAMEKSFIVLTDKTNNILVKKEDAKLAFQAHYDMVCVGDAPKLKLIEKKGLLSAKNSSLGADNGIGVAIMLYLIESDYNAEYLFTSDEEIGLIGANALELELHAKHMINLDSEEEGNVFIGCAGGVEIKATKNLTYKLANYTHTYKIIVDGLLGGHSGVDIDKNIPNAIKKLSQVLQTLHDYEIINLHGGVAPNAIPAHAFALISTDSLLEDGEGYRVEKIEDVIDPLIIDDAKTLLTIIDALPYGVIEQEEELPIPKTSINIGMLHIDNKQLTLELFPRSMDNQALDSLQNEVLQLCQSFGLETSLHAPYPAWTPHISTFSEKVLKFSKKILPESSFQAIHAGLECGIIKDKFPHMDVVSIGPNIYNPHSRRESIEIVSISKTLDIVELIIHEYA